MSADAELELRQLQHQINKAQVTGEKHATIETVNDYKVRQGCIMNETQSESNATHQVNHLTTNLS